METGECKNLLSTKEFQKFLTDKGYDVKKHLGSNPRLHTIQDNLVEIPKYDRKYYILDSKNSYSNFTDPVLFSFGELIGYYCQICQSNHFIDTDIGKKHATKENLTGLFKTAGYGVKKYILAKLVEDKTQLMFHRMGAFPKPNQSIASITSLADAEKRIGRKEYREADVKQGEVAFTQVNRLPKTAKEIGEEVEDLFNYTEEGFDKVTYIASALNTHRPKAFKASLKFFKAKSDTHIYMAAKAKIVVGHREHKNVTLEKGIWKVTPHSFVRDGVD